jgi:multimeric flavodoxin WrbA
VKAYIISDKDYQSAIFNRLYGLVTSYLIKKDFQIEHREIGRDELAFCKGCFGCWIKQPGECTIKDSMSEINDNFINSDVVVYLSPVIFGQFSANVKSAIDRWLPNILPFFITRPDGSTMHSSRYATYPKQIIIGYGETVSDEDAQLFVDITKKHRHNIEVLVFSGYDSDCTSFLNQTKLERTGGQL